MGAVPGSRETSGVLKAEYKRLDIGGLTCWKAMQEVEVGVEVGGTGIMGGDNEGVAGTVSAVPADSQGGDGTAMVVHNSGGVIPAEKKKERKIRNVWAVPFYRESEKNRLLL